jgi:hypothetical protein
MTNLLELKAYRVGRALLYSVPISTSRYMLDEYLEDFPLLIVRDLIIFYTDNLLV